MNPWKDSEAYAREARKVDSVGEALLLTLLWWRRDGWTVRVQEPVEQYRVDLFVPEARVAIEVDSFAAHGSNVAMERDAAKRNLVVARGWAPLAFSAQQVVFHTHDALAEAMAVIQRRLPSVERPSLPKPKPPPPDLRAFAEGGRALLAALAAGPADSIEEVNLSATLREMADRTPRERAAVEMFRIVLESPALIHAPLLFGALAGVDGPVTLAAYELAAAVTNGVLDEPGFLARCPAMLQPIALRQLRDWAKDPETAFARACETVDAISPGTMDAYRQAQIANLLAALQAPEQPPPLVIRRRR